MSEDRRFEFEIGASREEVWRALVDPTALQGWFASEARVSPQVGGEWFIAHGDYAEASTIDELVPNERLAASFEGKGVEFTLEGRVGTTVLRIVQSGFTDGELDSLERSWDGYVQTLRHFLTRHADESAQSRYVYAFAALSVEQARAVLPRTLPSDAEVVDDSARGLIARVPALGDGIHRASVEGRDGNVVIWVHLVAYGAGIARLDDIAKRVDSRLTTAVSEASAAKELPFQDRKPGA